MTELVQLLRLMDEPEFARAFSEDIDDLLSANKDQRLRALRDVRGMLREGSGTLADRYLTLPDGGPDIEASQRFRQLVVKIRSEAGWRLLLHR